MSNCVFAKMGQSKKKNCSNRNEMFLEFTKKLY